VRGARLTLRVAIGAVAALGVGFGVWFVGFDVLWAFAAMLVAGAVGGALATIRFDESAPWEPHVETLPRATRLTVAMIERSLTACDRPGRPLAMLISERDDHLARLAVVRQLRALLIAELHDRGIEPLEPFDDAVALIGPDAPAVLQPHNDSPVTSSAIARCLDAIERLANTHPGSR
jgi:hypothetical protein